MCKTVAALLVHNKTACMIFLKWKQFLELFAGKSGQRTEALFTVLIILRFYPVKIAHEI